MLPVAHERGKLALSELAVSDHAVVVVVNEFPVLRNVKVFYKHFWLTLQGEQLIVLTIPEVANLSGELDQVDDWRDRVRAMMQLQEGGERGNNQVCLELATELRYEVLASVDRIDPLIDGERHRVGHVSECLEIGEREQDGTIHVSQRIDVLCPEQQDRLVAEL